MGDGLRRREGRVPGALDRLDHRYPERYPRSREPDSENLAIWIWRALHPVLPQLKEITIGEDLRRRRYRGE